MPKVGHTLLLGPSHIPNPDECLLVLGLPYGNREDSAPHSFWVIPRLGWEEMGIAGVSQ